ncbi:MAG TPA: neutral/alkaline non-lysosomal ceramidase N-terminal domain-containing protein [Rhizobiaceae bacterium]|nr:neutral/alkaline non-lysosomal ceramidase N-terminal domain-containing protein [Rhizobiaceae bacterium]
MSAPLLAGAAVVDITPPAGLAMSGFVARTEPATGTHDPLTARALVVNDTAILAMDVLGLDRATTRAIAKRCALPDDNVVVAALHTHGGPQVRFGGYHAGIDQAYMAALETAAVEALDRAWDARRPAEFSFGVGRDARIARNRRRADGPTDPSLPVLDIVGTDGSPIATLLAYACHPVVLGADNRLWTADYPGFTRAAIEGARQGTVALFLTGCTADANNGHSAHASISLDADAERTFAAAERIGRHIASEALAAPLVPAGGGAAICSKMVELAFERRETESMQALAERWRAGMAAADPVTATLLAKWISWAERGLPADLASLRIACRVTALRWGNVEIIALPGEIFAETAHDIRRRIGNPAAIVIGFADDNPGYIPPAAEYPFGGYEVDEAHRYYGQPASFAPGSAEALADAAVGCVLALRSNNQD